MGAHGFEPRRPKAMNLQSTPDTVTGLDTHGNHKDDNSPAPTVVIGSIHSYKAAAEIRLCSWSQYLGQSGISPALPSPMYAYTNFPSIC